MDDYYSILGVPKNASPEDIKKAYRKLAMQYHPDRGGDEKKFKEINEAYDTLGDTSKKASYDNPQVQGNHFNFNGGFGGNPFEDLFGQFGNAFGQRPRNRDLTVLVTIDLKEVLTGKHVLVSYRLSNGNLETVEVGLPPGVENGNTIRYQGLGDTVDPRFPRGDLYVKVKVNNNSKWRREGNHLYTKESVNLFDILLGCVIIIETLDDRTVQLKIPKGTKPGTTFSITGYGVTNMHNRVRGNAYVQIEPIIPNITNPVIIEKMQEINDLIKKEK